jgi:hypothetical protein
VLTIYRHWTTLSSESCVYPHILFLWDQFQYFPHIYSEVSRVVSSLLSSLSKLLHIFAPYSPCVLHVRLNITAHNARNGPIFAGTMPELLVTKFHTGTLSQHTTLEIGRYLPVPYRNFSLLNFIPELLLFLNFIPALINTYYIHLSFSIFLTVCPCFAFKYTGTSKLTLRGMNTWQKTCIKDWLRLFTHTEVITPITRMKCYFRLLP